MEKSIIIAVFCYNRAAKLKMCIEALLRNPECPSCDIIFFSDGFKTEGDKLGVLEVREYINSIVGFRNVIKHFRDRNFSTGPNFETGLKFLSNNYDEFIVIEDDLVVSPNYIKYMTDALTFYKSDESIFCVTGYVFPLKVNDYSYDTLVYKRFCSYGWAIWSNRLRSVIWDNDGLQNLLHTSTGFERRLNEEGRDLSRMLKKQLSGKISTWDIQMQTHVAENRLKVIYPTLSKVANIGFDGESTNTFGINYLLTPVDPGLVRSFKCCPANVIDLNLQSQIKAPYSLHSLIFRKSINECIGVVNKLKRLFLNPSI
jgi:glycosyltransferase involved in cell wall biosynthesis